MGKQSDLSSDKKSKIITLLGQGLNKNKISKKLKSKVKTIHSFVNNPNRNRKPSDKGKKK